MGKATVTQATVALANLQGLSDVQRHTYQAEVDAARAAAENAGHTEADRIDTSVRDARDGLLTELCAVRDGLAVAQQAGDRQAITQLRRQQQQLMGRVEEIERLAAQVEEIEADPFAYGEALFAKFHHIRPDFTFL
jgi:hypothetical protein